MIDLKNYINGALIPPINQIYLDNLDPSSGKVFAKVPRSSEADVEQAYQAARKAFPKWANLSVEKRHDYLTSIAQEIKANLTTLAKAESLDNGKPVSLATEVDIPRAAANFEFFANAITQFSSEAHETNQDAINYTLRRPMGVVGCISPWNLPLYLFSWKIAPALAVGNTVVAKPSELTPYTAFLLAKICQKINLPKGVLNIVHGLGHEAGQALVAHPKIKAISFTGGTITGQKIASIVAPMFKKVSLELGGKNAALVFADCDYEKTLEKVVESCFANQGQICLCSSRIWIERPLYESFKADFVAKVKALTIGHPSQQVNLGATVSKPHLNKVLSYIELAKKEGGQILCGGKSVTVPNYENGCYIAPTIIENLAYDCRTNQEEIFGPVVTIAPFDTEKEALTYCNSVKYGLATSVWTSNIERSMRLSTQIESGIVWINTWLYRDLRTPFGGMKESGLGREGGQEALRFFTEPKNVCIKY